MEGVIQFICHRANVPSNIDTESLAILNKIRSILKEHNMLGQTTNGIGFGNISLKTTGKQFYITASQTGHLPVLGVEDVSLVARYDILSNQVWCMGIKSASSESLTHAAVYEASEKAGAVIHIHHAGLWNQLKGKIFETSKDSRFGSVEMALDVMKIVTENRQESGILRMPGHEEGLLVWGKDTESAWQIVNQYYRFF